MANLNLKTAGLKETRRTPPNELIPYLKRWQSNNSPTDLGIVRFIFDLYEINRRLGYIPLIKKFEPSYGVAPWAAKSLAAVYYYEKGINKYDRAFVIRTYRGGSKTFWYGYVSPIYDALIGQYGIYCNNVMLPENNYQIIRSKNSREAEKRFLGISSFFNKPIIKRLFGELKPTYKQIQTKEYKDTGNLLILSNDYIFECSGIDQPSRGLNLFQLRPTKFVYDDPQNRENTKTPGRREQCDKEVMEESFAALEDTGCVIYIGNMVHPEDTLTKLMSEENTSWKKFDFTLTLKKDGSRGTCNLDEEVPEWPARYTIESIKKMRDWWVSQPKLGGIRSFLKEYYNYIKSEVNYKVKYHDVRYFREFGINWIALKENDKEEILNVNIYVGADPAISKRKDSSDAAITVVCVDPYSRRFVLEYSVGKFDLFDKTYDGDNNQILVPFENKYLLEKIGTADEVIRYALKYRVDGIAVESGVGVQEVFYNSIKSKLEKLNHQCVLAPIIPREKKEEKLKQVPLGYVETGLYYIRETMIALDNEISFFGDGSKKDILDSIYNIEMILQIPPKIEYHPRGPVFSNTVYKTPEPQLPNRNSEIGNLTKPFESWIVI